MEELRVGHQILVTFDATVADGADHFEAVVETVATSNDVEGAGEETVSESFGAVFTGFSGVAQFAVDADGGAQTPVAGVAVEVGESAGLAGVPGVDAVGGVVGCAGEAEALENFGGH